MSRILFPAAALDSSISISVSSDLRVSESSTSGGVLCLAFSGTETWSHLAKNLRVVPCKSTEVSEMKNTTLKIICDLSIPASSG
jgi:hypothetical protein